MIKYSDKSRSAFCLWCAFTKTCSVGVALLGTSLVFSCIFYRLPLFPEYIFQNWYDPHAYKNEAAENE